MKLTLGSIIIHVTTYVVQMQLSNSTYISENITTPTRGVFALDKMALWHNQLGF